MLLLLVFTAIFPWESLDNKRLSRIELRSQKIFSVFFCCFLENYFNFLKE